MVERVGKGAWEFKLTDNEKIVILSALKENLTNIKGALASKTGRLRLVCLTIRQRQNTPVRDFCLCVLEMDKGRSPKGQYTLPDETDTTRIWPPMNDWFVIHGTKGAKKDPLSIEAKSALINEVIKLCNDERRKANKPLNQLKMNLKLVKSAQTHAQNMAAKNKECYHNNTLPPGVHSENVHAGPRTAVIVMNGGNRVEKISDGKSITKITTSSKGFMQSPGHKENILTGRFKNIGVGVAVSIKGEYYWCQQFCE